MEKELLLWGYDVRAIDVFVTVFGAIATIVIAIFAYRISHLQIWGRKPLLMEVNQHFSVNDAPPRHLKLILKHQIWNNRPYAIRVDGHRLTFDKPVLKLPELVDAAQWTMSGQRRNSNAGQCVIEAAPPKSWKPRFILRSRR